MKVNGMNYVLSICIALFLACCAMTEKSTQLPDTGALVILGNTTGATLQVDDSEPIELEKGGRSTAYTLSKGTRHIRIRRGTQLIVDRLLFVGIGQTVEVKVP